MPDALPQAVALAAALLTGPLAVAVATLAVAAVGFGMLAGRIAWRRAGMATLGGALVFGSAQIAQGLIGGGGAEPETLPAQEGDIAEAAPAPAPPVSPPEASDALARAYAAARQAVLIRFPHAAGTAVLTATVADDGHLVRLDARGQGLDGAALAVISRIVAASGVRLAGAGGGPTALPALEIGGRDHG